MKPWTYFDLIKKEYFGIGKREEDIKPAVDNVSATECTECAKEPQNTPPVDAHPPTLEELRRDEPTQS